MRAKTDPKAFGEIFDANYDRMFGFALKRVGDADVAADIAAEVFAKALKGVGWFSWRGIPISVWLYRIAQNEINMYFRKRKYLPASLSALMDAGYDSADDMLVAERRELETILQSADDEARVREVLGSLSRIGQEVIALRYFEGLRTKEIAKILGKPEGTVRSLLSRAVADLRTEYEKSLQQKPASGIIDSEGRNTLLLQTREL